MIESRFPNRYSGEPTSEASPPGRASSDASADPALTLREIDPYANSDRAATAQQTWAEPARPPHATQQAGAVSELYTDLFAGSDSTNRPVQTPAAGPYTDQRPVGRPVEDGARTMAPRSPGTLVESGLSLMQVCDLILKQLYLHGSLFGYQIARNAHLAFSVIDECLRFLKDEKCIEVSSGELLGRVSYRFNLTDLGRVRSREAFEQCRYVGPAPVPLSDYVTQCRRQAVAGTECTPEALVRAFDELIIPPNLLEELGPAVCSGQSIFVYGPPGNGKTMVAKGLGKFLNSFGGEIHVPYAIHTENSIVTVFDPTIHQTTDDAELRALGKTSELPNGRPDPQRLMREYSHDLRWRRIRRPVVITGGELTLEMLDLRYNKTSNFYTAPLHVKANGGVFLVDDFGRQIISPRDLLNRWILPLEEHIDFLTMATGKKFSVPFEQLIIFSTNLDPRELVDEAFLRRIRHKIQIGPPSRELFTQIFHLCCEQRQLPFTQDAVDYLFSNYYDRGKPPRSSDPRDLLEIVQSICRFRKQRIVLTRELIAEAAQRFFCQV